MSFPFPLPLVLDGSTGISLYRRGMPQGVCCEDWVLRHPDALCDLQKAFYEAGSDAVYAPTFAANRAKLAHYGLDGETARMNRELVALSRSQANGRLVGGDLTTTGLFIEPFGDATFDEVVDIYREQTQALAEAGADFLIFETMMNLFEVRAALLAGRETGLPMLVTITVNERGRTLSGASTLCCYAVARSLGAAAFGLNCSFGPERMLGQLRQIAPYADIPLIAKPNAGMPRVDDPLRYDLSAEEMGERVEALLAAGVQIVGGCCGASPDYIAAIRRTVDRFDFSQARVEKDLDAVLVCDSADAWFLPALPEFTDPIECGPDLADDLMAAAESDANAALIDIRSPADAEAFAESAYLLKLPVAFRACDAAALERALFQYQGRAIVDSGSELEEDALRALADRYGAVVY